MTSKAGHTATKGPAFVSGVRFKMNGSEWHAISRYDQAKKRDENIACVGFDPRTGEGLADAHFIAEAFTVAHDTGLTPRQLAERCEKLEAALVGVTNLYCELVNSGDAGFWDPEKVDEVIAARAALAKATAGGA
jgi:hypothetical protein